MLKLNCQACSKLIYITLLKLLRWLLIVDLGQNYGMLRLRVWDAEFWPCRKMDTGRCTLINISHNPGKCVCIIFLLFLSYFKEIRKWVLKYIPNQASFNLHFQIYLAWMQEENGQGGKSFAFLWRQREEIKQLIFRQTRQTAPLISASSAHKRKKCYMKNTFRQQRQVSIHLSPTSASTSKVRRGLDYIYKSF